MTAKRAGIYARISQDDGTALGAGRQIDDFAGEAARRGWEFVGQYVDNNVSASRTKPRPECEQLLEDGITETLEADLVTADARVIATARNPALAQATGAGARAAWEASPLEQCRSFICALCAVRCALCDVTVLPSGPRQKFTPDQVHIYWKA